MRHAWIAAAAAMLFAGAAASQPYGMGPGMMGGYGPGMMGGYGPGPGMMGGYGHGPGMMWGGGHRGDYWGLELSAEQRRKIDEIQQETAKTRWQLMGTMHQQGWHMQGLHGPGPVDEAEARKAFKAMSEAREQMFELMLGERKRIDAVLTNEQREQLRRRWGGR